MMEARGESVSDHVAETRLPHLLPSIHERSPLLDRRALRGSSSRSAKSVSVFRLQKSSSSRTRPAAAASQNLKKNADRPPSISPGALHRSRSAPLHRYTSSPQHPPLPRSQTSPQCPDHPPFRSSPLYRVNPAVRFNERLLPERMNYGIAGYNTSRPRNFAGGASSGTYSKRGVVIRTRPRSVQILKLWTRKLRVRMIRNACSRFMMRFRRRR